MSEFHALQTLWSFPRAHIPCALRILNEGVGLSVAETPAAISGHFERCFQPEDVVVLRPVASAAGPSALSLAAAPSAPWRVQSVDARSAVIELWEPMGSGVVPAEPATVPLEMLMHPTTPSIKIVRGF